MSKPMNVGIYVFENMTMLDGYAPLQMLSFVESFNAFTFARTTDIIRTDCGARIQADYDLESCPPLDIIVMAGGGDVLPEMTDAPLIDFLQRAGESASYVTSVCTGAMILAEAGLLDGYQATTHWAWIDALKRYPDISVVDQRVAVDRNRITGGGITAGIDFSLTLIAEVVGAQAAQAVQLLFEYRPQPPFDSGNPATAPAPLVDAVRAQADVQRQPLNAWLEQRFVD